MNRHAMLHIVDSSYCFPVSEKEIVLRLRTARDDVHSVEVIYENKYVFGTSRLKLSMPKAYSSELYDYYEVKLELNDTRLAYVFYLFDGERYYYFSEDGITDKYDFTLGFYNFFQYPYINRADIMECVDWMKKAVFYQIFVDRFNIGNTQKDISYITCKWGDIPNSKTFAGGDLKGITEKLDYIKSIGCNTIYLTPIFKSISNHKYDISDYYCVDKQFGTNEDLQELVEEIHARDMKIVLDAVFNHCSEELTQFQDVLKKGKASEYFDWFIIDGDSINQSRDNYEMFAACNYMPKFNTSNEDVVRFLVDVGCHYIQKYNIDGWRLDVSDEVSHEFWRIFRKKIKSIKKDAVLIGENWHDAYTNLRGDQYDSIMNYSFTKACLDYFAFDEFDAQHFAWKLNEILMRNNGTVNKMMLNLLESHDTHRFFSEVSENRFKIKAAIALMYLFPGVPCVYYGMEILMPGGYDPDCRRCMNWEKAKKDGEYADIYDLLTKLATIRNNYNISDGKVRISAVNNIFILKNSLDNCEITLLINNTDTPDFAMGIKMQAQSFSVMLNERVII